MANEQKVTFGPHGGSGGEPWDDGTYNIVREIIIYSASEIRTIHVVYDDGEGNPINGKKHDRNSGQQNTVKLNYPSEYLVSISGHIENNTDRVVKSLTLQSNIRQYGPYGKEEGTPFMNPITSGKIVGFFGRQGKPVSGKKHGSDGGQQNTVKLDYPDEFLLSVWGYHGQVDKMVVIRSLGFQSNKRTYGPFGVEDGENFEFRSNASGKIIGFHGRSDKYLTAIGAYLDK
ncbi:jacalin-related lectin 19-like [Cornus florida]|uniref:jacalin-related lectin 19-like n=1 Tax=Cornus florida TaxID=4283 RepID=UPI002897765D|nr:jacalin-related lectin 19-like [Cornus florida]